MRTGRPTKPPAERVPNTVLAHLSDDDYGAVRAIAENEQRTISATVRLLLRVALDSRRSV